MKRPAFMFYPADWRTDPGLRVCKIAAKGLWIEIISLMHEAEPYGHLIVSGRAVDDAQLARLVGESVAVVRRLLAELESHQVFSRTALGVIYSRRMVEDERIRNLRAAGGKLGGNPALMDNAEVEGKVAEKVGSKVNQKPTPSVAVAVPSSSSSSPSPPPTLPPTAAAGSGRVNFLTPYLDAHLARFPDSSVEGIAARYGKVFKRIEAKHPPSEVLRRWVICLAVKGTYGTPEELEKHWPEYSVAKPQNGTAHSKQERGRAALRDWLEENKRTHPQPEETSPDGQ